MFKVLALVVMVGCSADKAEAPPPPPKTHRVADLLSDYRAAEVSGNALDACVNAGLLNITYKRIGDTDSAKHWRQIERVYCPRAGITAPPPED